MFSVFTKRAIPLLYLVALLPAHGNIPAFAESGNVNVVGSGKEISDAFASILRNVMAKYFANEPTQLTKSVFQSEMLPNAASFVQSYRVLDGNRSSYVSINASVDLDVIRGLLSLTPAKLGMAGGAKALLVVRGAPLPSGMISAKKDAPPANPYTVLESAVKERLVRRGFEVISLSPDEMLAIGAGEDVSSPELLRGLASKTGARLALGITSRYENFENENSHSKEERIVLSATLVDSKSSTPERASVNVNDPQSRREQYVADLQRQLLENSKELFQDIFVAAGKRTFRSEARTDYSVVRVLAPQNPSLVNSFRILLEKNPALKSVVEFSIQRGAFDFAVRPALSNEALAKLINGLSSEEISISLLPEAPGPADGSPKANAVVSLAQKEKPADAPKEGVQNETP